MYVNADIDAIECCPAAMSTWRYPICASCFSPTLISKCIQTGASVIVVRKNARINCWR